MAGIMSVPLDIKSVTFVAWFAGVVTMVGGILILIVALYQIVRYKVH